MVRKDQSGLSAVVLVVVGAVLILGVLVSVMVYRARRPQASTISGLVISQSCPPHTDCQPQSLSTSDGTKYGLSGVDASSYVGQNVTVNGTTRPNVSSPVIDVTSIKPVDPNPSPAPTPSPTSTSNSSSSSFNAEQFYNQVQKGMTYAQVKDLAGGQAGECELSNAPPPTDYMTCTWKDSATSVSVDFTNQKVSNKSKHNL